LEKSRKFQDPITAIRKVTDIAEGGGLYPNMFDAHPPEPEYS